MMNDDDHLYFVTTQFRRRSKGPVIFNGCSPAGDVILIENLHSKKLYDLSGWSIERQTDSDPLLKYVLPKHSSLPAGSTLELWAENGQPTFENDDQLIIRTDLPSWNLAKKWSVTTLYDNTGKEKAMFLHRILSEKERKCKEKRQK